MNEKGFTLLEMLLVLVVISVLLLLIIPGVVQQRERVNAKGCEALVKSTEAQVQAYQLENNTWPTAEQLVDGDYISTDKCPNGKVIVVSDEGAVTLSDTE
ncbi:competence type IV pilus major pilin ComGC [Ectobacillus antri]|jgi:competence protein ComGC|uniref:ComG operon protein 3 n=1 Tax=Ectobacillus antri TaxID=2486280 RepID=A0ABT6H1N0_9BACI|nr:competence type IV pilus major pilin ComGC [Ectobacillus antri]MDG4655558.1 competence type IV pilus major pilin ComGC [Ectobacillus antri]MDG5753316.1 competence type IV pilus major pilin ComGC [Ectobacillus antri]